jgi:hypothetical protein
MQIYSVGYNMIYDMIYLSNAIGLTPGGSSTVHIYTQTVHRITQLIWEECGPLDRYVDIFVNCNWVDSRWQYSTVQRSTVQYSTVQYSTHSHTNSTQNDTMKQNTQNGTHITIRIHKYNNKNIRKLTKESEWALWQPSARISCCPVSQVQT